MKKRSQMKGKMNIKSTFKKIGKISVITFFIVLAIMVCFVLATKVALYYGVCFDANGNRRILQAMIARF